MKIRSLLLATALTFSATAKAQPAGSQPSTEEQFQDLFVTAGYATAFGAALGAAALTFSGNPERHLRYVAVGASLGFLSGSAFGSYLIFAPSFASSDKEPHESLIAEGVPHGKLVLRPEIDLRSLALKSVTGSMTLLTF